MNKIYIRLPLLHLGIDFFKHVIWGTPGRGPGRASLSSAIRSRRPQHAARMYMANLQKRGDAFLGPLFGEDWGLL
jgi:hypothetical protein